LLGRSWATLEGNIGKDYDLIMELKEFISQALLDIVGGIEDAQTKTPSGRIVPSGVKNDYKSVEAGISELQAVDFEVTVTADERSGTEAKLSVVAAVVGGGVKGESAKSGGHVATLRFRVPMLLQTSKRK